ncbi:MAG: hypothetical protein EXQ96_05775 [Alphaproteobacteria bacterium]|nr:hypothetical protein [Alphaproteobacteria bacterium]
MKSALLAQVEARLRAATPIVLTLLCVLLAAIPWPIPGAGAATSGVTVAAVYFWSVWRPDFLPAPAVMLIGAFQDCLAGTPFGLYALLLVVAQGLTLSQRRFLAGKFFAVVWVGFALIAPAVAVVGWCVAGIASGALLPPGPLLLQVGVQVALFPALAALLLPALRFGLRAT